MELKASSRTVLRKKVGALRRQGITPGNMYGHGMQSQAIQIPTVQLQQALKTSGRNAVLDLVVETDGQGKGETHKVIVRELQRNPMTDQILHIDLFRVLMTEKMQVEVPIALVGVAPAVDLGLGTLVQNVREVRVEGLPDALPSVVEVDISSLVDTSHSIMTKDIILPAGITLASDADQVVASVVGRRGETLEEEEEAAAQAEAQAEAAEAAAAEAEEDNK